MTDCLCDPFPHMRDSGGHRTGLNMSLLNEEMLTKQTNVTLSPARGESVFDLFPQKKPILYQNRLFISFFSYLLFEKLKHF
jgi:hypothetical protein